MDWMCKTRNGLDVLNKGWIGFVKHGFVKHGFAKHEFVKYVFVRGGFVKDGFVRRKGGLRKTWICN